MSTVNPNANATLIRLKKAVNAGVKIKAISDKSEISYFRIASVINPEKYKGESKFDRFEVSRINEALDAISAEFSIK